MLKRAWLVMAGIWALLMLCLGASSDTGLADWGWGPWLIALGPLALPRALRYFFGYVIFGQRPGQERRRA